MNDYDGFYRASKDGVLAYLLRMTGDYHLSCDLVQESFARYLARYRDKIKSRSLLYTIARNAALDALRKPRADSYDAEAHGDLQNNPEQQVINQQTFNQVQQAIRQLPDQDRELIALVAGADLSYRQIGKILKISEPNVKVKVHRARIKLKKILDSGGG